MSPEKSNLQKRIESGKPIVLAEITPPKAPDAEGVRALAKSFAGKVHALGISDNREGVRMSALAAASIMVSGGVEPVLHLTTRDRNRTALVSDCIGAHALGIRNILCTSGTHQTLLPFHAAKNVFDIDATILLQLCKNLEKNASIVGEDVIPGPLSFCLGSVGSPYADPFELQMVRLAQKISAGAQFVITHPVFDTDRFLTWWKEVINRGLDKRAAFIAGIRVLTDAAKAKTYTEKRPDPVVGPSIVQRLASKPTAGAARKEGILMALETIEKLSAAKGMRGFEVFCDEENEAALEVLEGLKSRIG